MINFNYTGVYQTICRIGGTNAGSKKNLQALLSLFFLLFSPALFAQFGTSQVRNTDLAYLNRKKTTDNEWRVISTGTTNTGANIEFSAGSAFASSATIDQLRNGGIGEQPPSGTNFQNGNAGPENSHFIEGWSIPYRVIVDGLTPGAHYIEIEWDIMGSSGGKHAIDYITSFQNLGSNAIHQPLFGHPTETVNPVGNLSGTYVPGTPGIIPAPYNTAAPGSLQEIAKNSFNTLNLKTFSIYNGNITALSYVSEGSFVDGAKTRFRIDFTTTSEKVVLAWGGHIASQADWGIGKSASDINGSPYHSRVITLDGTSIGNQDRSLKADAVVVVPDCIISGPSTACSSGGALAYTASLTNVSGVKTHYKWSLANNTAGATFTPNPAEGDINPGETVVPGISVTGYSTGSFTVVLEVSRVFSGVTFKHTCSKQVTVTAPSVTVSAPSVCEGESTTITATPNPAGTYTYQWTVPAGVTNPGNVASFSTSVEGIYSVKVTDGNNCSATNSATFSFYDKPTVSVTAPARCSNGPASTITATPNPAGTYTYQWTVPAGVTNPGNVASFSATVGGVYSVKITDANGCTATGSATLVVNQAPSVTVSAPSVCEGSSTTVTATPSGGTGPYSYVWTVPAGASNPGNVASFTATVEGTYSVVVTDSKGCKSAPGQASFSFYESPIVSITDVVLTGLSVQFQATTTGGTAPYTWLWETLDGTLVFNNATVEDASGTLGTPSAVARITATDANGCKASDERDLVVEFNCTITGEPEVCTNGTATYSVSADPALNGITFEWSLLNNTSGASFVNGVNTGSSVQVNTGAKPGGYTLQVNTLYNGSIIATCTLDVVVNSCESNCTYTQGYYGNKNGNSCDDGTIYPNPGGANGLIYHLLQQGGAITIGVNSGSYKYITIPATLDGANKVNAVMPGGGTAGPLTHSGTGCNILNACFNTYLSKVGRINNVLLSQTIALSLNIRTNDGALATFPIQNGWLTTQDEKGCGDNATLVECTADASTIRSILMNKKVADYLIAKNAATVQGLLDLANAVLGGALIAGSNGVPSFSDITAAIDAINNAFDQCRASLGYFDTKQACPPLIVEATATPSGSIDETLVQSKKLSVSAFPNPYSSKVRFTFSSPEQGEATLELFNMLGQRVSTIYRGQIPAGREQFMDYTVPISLRTNLIYILRVNGRQVTGKLMNLR